jgi:SPX domain protein involved in polyphosphate accumulation
MYSVQTLEAELAKVCRFFVDQEAHLQSTLDSLRGAPPATLPAALAALHKGVQDLTKFAALNYVAVLKAVKKRNRRLRDVCGDVVVTVAPFSILKHQTFFTSRELARITAASLALEKVRREGMARCVRCDVSEKLCACFVVERIDTHVHHVQWV